MGNFSVRVAGWCARRAWWVVGGWVVLVALCLGVGLGVGNRPAVTADYRVGEAGRAEGIAAEGGVGRRPVEYVMITGRAVGAEMPVDAGVVTAVTQGLAGVPGVVAVGEPVWSRDRRAVRIDLTLGVDEREAARAAGEVRARTEAVQRARPEVVVTQTGRASIGRAVEQQRGQDIARVEMITLPVTLVTLVLVFFSLGLALVPVLLALSSIAAAVGLSMVASHVFPDAGVGTNVILLIGMAVGVDYSLFYLKREREERARAGGRLCAVALVDLAAATAGRVVVTSGLAVVVSSATLYLVDDVIFSSLATGAVLVTLVAVVSSMTVLPAALVLLGRTSERRARRVPAGKVTGALIRGIERNPVRTLVAATLVLLALAAPILGMRITDMGPETHPRELAAVQAYHQLTDTFPEVKAIHQVVVRGAGPEATKAIADLALRDPSISGPATVRTSADGRTQVLDLAVPHFVSEQAAQDSLRRLREQYVPAVLGQMKGVEYAVSGDVARYVDYPRHQQERLPWVIGALLLVTLLITAVAFRSVVLGVIGVVLNLLSAAAAIGVLVWVFQGRWAEGLLDFTSTGSIGSRVPLFLFVILFGLSMDYQFFFISRVREAVLAGVPTRRAVFEGMRRSASVITSAALVMVTVFAAFVGVHLIEVKQTGLSLAVAVLVDAFVVRTLVLPSLLLVLGDRVWWPRSVR
ncbi:MMPL family transporter [Actinokineospora cianjurensis]|uniref:RND superfamily putative drug exporter n=1 Tax=Actinokineospora cianjurensis TaxID=585224 RepID=A0A421BBY9_9PSEU|nr:MMPL family transporter [Actinokineospora cianjurensis]RLK61840.1 RND superfamily putative drug exporter [Actinokineospora cianjurensis]